MKANQRLKHEREQRGWSQSKLAGLVGTNPATIGRWERGISLPYPFHRERLCELFDKDARELGLIEEATPQNDGLEPEPALHPPAASFIFDPALPLPSVETSTLVGRDTLLKQIKQQLYAPGTPAFSAITGLPGVGKTALALTLAHDDEMQKHFSDGILWVGLGTRPDIRELLGHWGALLGLPTNEIASSEHTDEWTRTLRGLIGRRRMLLILDDAWNIDDALAFLVGGPNCAYIVTTRFPQIGMQIAANQLTTVSELSEEDGVALLARFVPALVEQDAATAQRLVQSVGALPLALVLVGKYLRSHAYNEQPRRLRSAISYVGDIEQRFDLSEPRSPAQPHPGLHDGTPLSLRSIIALSHERLDEQARAMLRALTIFPAKPASFPEQAALAVGALPVETLDRLCDAGLLQSSGPERYTVHQTIADYARMQPGEHETTLYRRLIEYMIGYLEEHKHDYDALAHEHHIIIMALEEAYSRVMLDEYARGVCAFASFLCMRGLYDQARRHLQQAERATQAAQAPQDTDRIAGILFHLGHLATLQSEYDLAETYLKKGLQYANQAQQVCLFRTHLGSLIAKRGDYRKAENYLQEALHLARDLDEQDIICQALTDLGHIMMRKGNYERAEMHLQEGFVLANQLASRKHRSHLLTELGVIAGSKDNHAQAYVYFQEALEEARQLGYQDAIARLLSNLSGAAEALQNYAQAEKFLQEGLVLARRLGNHARTSLLLNNLGSLLSVQGDYSRACIHYQEGLSLARQINHPWLVYSILGDWGDTHLSYQRLDAAQTAFHEVIKSAPEKFQEARARAHYGLARTLAKQGNILEARRYCEASIVIFERIGIPTVSAARQLLSTLPMTTSTNYKLQLH